MNQEIFGLRYDFVYRHGHYMELYRDEGIAPDELSTLQLRMLEANQVPNHLPLEVQEVDFRISLLYHLTSKRMLAHLLKVEGLTKQQFVKLLYAIVCALQESKNYMLHEMGYVLKDNFIFIGTDWSDVYLTYVPLTQMNEDASVLVPLETFLMQLADKVKEEDRQAALSWGVSLSKCRALSEYKVKLLSLMDEATVVREEPLTQLKSHYEPEEELQKSMEIDRLNEMPRGPENRLPKPLWSRNDDVPSYGGEYPVEADENGIKLANDSFVLEVSKRSQIIVRIVLLLFTSFLWQNYLTYPSTGSLRITTGLTILFADIWFVIKFVGIPRFKIGKSPRSSSVGELQVQREQEQLQPPPQADISDYYRNLHMHTTLLSSPKPNATVYLGSRSKRPLGARLEVLMDGVNQIHTLTNDNFAIGRGDAEVKADYVLDESGVSRLHAEIIKDGDNYGIKDLGSTNGTFLNGEALVAYQIYPLQEGDVLRIVRIEMTFRV